MNNHTEENKWNSRMLLDDEQPEPVPNPTKEIPESDNPSDNISF